MEAIDRPRKRLRRQPPRRDPERLTPHQVRWDNAGLGMRPDSAIAADMGVDVATVARERQFRRIPSFTELTRGKPPARLCWEDVRLGHKPDSVIAAEMGVTTDQVRRARERRGIKAFVNHTVLRGENTRRDKDEQ